MVHQWKQERTTAAAYAASQRYQAPGRSTTVSRDELEAARSARHSESLSSAQSMGSAPPLAHDSFAQHRSRTTDSMRSSLGLSECDRGGCHSVGVVLLPHEGPGFAGAGEAHAARSAVCRLPAAGSASAPC